MTTGFYSFAKHGVRDEATSRTLEASLGLRSWRESGNRPTELEGQGNPDSEREFVLRELEKQQIRVKLLAEEIAKRRRWEDEVGLQLMRERELARRRKWEAEVGIKLKRERELALFRLKSPTMRSHAYQCSNFDNLGSRFVDERRSASLPLDMELGFWLPEASPLKRNSTTTTGVLNWMSPDTGTSSVAGKETIVLVKNPEAVTSHSNLKRKPLADLEADVGVRNTSLNEKTNEEVSCGLSTIELGLSEHLQDKKRKENQAGPSALKIDIRSVSVSKDYFVGGIVPVDKIGSRTPALQSSVKSDEKSSDLDRENAIVVFEEIENGISSWKTEMPLKPNASSTCPSNDNLKAPPKAPVRSHTNDDLQKMFKFWCEICEVGAISVKTLNDHNNGEEHLAKLQASSKGKVEPTTGVFASPGAKYACTTDIAEVAEKKRYDGGWKESKRMMKETVDEVGGEVQTPRNFMATTGVPNSGTPCVTKKYTTELGVDLGVGDTGFCGARKFNSSSEHGFSENLQVLQHETNQAGLSVHKTGFGSAVGSKSSLSDPVGELCGTTAVVDEESQNDGNAISTIHSYKNIETPIKVAARSRNDGNSQKWFKFECKVFGVRADSTTTMSAHYNGKRHKAKLKALAKSTEEPTSRPVDAPGAVCKRRSEIAKDQRDDGHREIKRTKKETVGEGGEEERILRNSLTATWICNSGTSSAEGKETIVLVKETVTSPCRRKRKALTDPEADRGVKNTSSNEETGKANQAGPSAQKIGHGSAGIPKNCSIGRTDAVDINSGIPVTPKNCCKSGESFGNDKKTTLVAEENQNGTSSSNGTTELAVTKNDKNLGILSKTAVRSQIDGNSICGVRTDSMKTMSNHYNGKKHLVKRKALGKSRAEPTSGFVHAASGASYKRGSEIAAKKKDDGWKESKRMKKETVSEGGGEDRTPRNSRTTTGIHNGGSRKGFRFWCDMCQVGTSSPKDINCHLSGKKHLDNITLRQAKARPLLGLAGSTRCHVWRREAGKENGGLQNGSK